MRPADSSVPARWLAVALLLAACGPAVRTPEVRLQSINATSGDETAVALEIINPNRFPLHILSVDYEVSVDGRLCGKGRRSEALFLDARDTTLADFPLAIDYAGLLKSIPALLTDSAVFSVRGSYVVSTFIGRRRFGFSGERKISFKDEVESIIRGLYEN
jgi:LEA14-like dessication related protein